MARTHKSTFSYVWGKTWRNLPIISFFTDTDKEWESANPDGSITVYGPNEGTSNRNDWRATAKKVEKIETIGYVGKLSERTDKYPPAVRYAIDRLRVGSENLLKGIGGIGVKSGNGKQTEEEKKKARKEAITEELVTRVDAEIKQEYPNEKEWSEDVNKLQWITMQVSAYYDRGVDPNRKMNRGSGDTIDNAAVQKTVYNMMNDVLSWYDNPDGMSPWGQKLGQVTEEFLKEKESVKGTLKEKGHVVKEQPAPTKTAAKVNPAVIGGVRQSR